MFFTHNSNLMPEPPTKWETTDGLPRNAFAHTGDANDKASWKYPHHFTMGVEGKENVQSMWLSKDGLMEAMESAGKDQNVQAIKHLAAHAKAIGIDSATTIELLGIDEAKYDGLTSNIAYIATINQTGGEETMDDIKNLQAKITELEQLLTTANGTIATLQGADTEKTIKDLQAQVETLTTEKGALEKQIADLNDTLKNANAFAEVGKKAIDALKADILKIAAQVDGDTFDKAIMDKQIEAFGNDFELLTKFKGQFEARRQKMFKAGEIHQDPNADQPGAQSDQKDYNVGRLVGGGKVIDMQNRQ